MGRGGAARGQAGDAHTPNGLGRTPRRTAHLRHREKHLLPPQAAAAAGRQGAQRRHKVSEQRLAVAQEDEVEEGGVRLRVAGQHRAAAEYQRVAVRPVRGQQRDSLLLQQRQHIRIVQLPRERKPNLRGAAAPLGPRAGARRQRTRRTD